MATSITNTSVTTDNLTVDTNVFHVDSTNNHVGFGTATPQAPIDATLAAGNDWVARFQNTTSATPYGVQVYDAPSASNGYPLLQVTNSAGSGTYFRVDSGTGIVTKPYQPSFLMKKYSGGATAIANNTVWTYDEALTNVGGHANISNGRFTAPVAGSYCFMWHNIGESSSAVYRSFIRYNASSTWGSGSYRLESRNFHSGGYPNASAQVVVYLNASDYVDIYVTGGSIYSDQTNGVWFCGFLIG
ncbi:MAG: hypothetical protein CMH04_00835 [Marinovum sp.]|nr:hypothetical protein [Marinovum sp.]|tara:strand:+ start:826 stop:1557 length:732 start_codon:yes stop_codon:yes gene_type:complete